MIPMFVSSLLTSKPGFQEIRVFSLLTSHLISCLLVTQTRVSFHHVISAFTVVKLFEYIGAFFVFFE